MSEDADRSQPAFWTARYEAGNTPWDFGGAPASLHRFLARSPGTGRVLIPGCGFGYEVRAFHAAGYEVTALDFAPGAIARAKSVLGPLADRVRLGDFFTYDFGARPFDLVYERTFLCALSPERWPEYGKRVASLVRPGGRLVGVFLHGESLDPPPHPLGKDQAVRILGGAFRLDLAEAVTDSLPVFKGLEEKWLEWTRLNR